MHDIVIREARKSDIDRLYAIETESFSDPWTRSMLEPVLESNTAFVAVAELDGEICGFVCVYAVPGSADDINGEAELADIATAVSCRLMGIAKRLFEFVYAELKKRYCRYIYLEVRQSNTAACSLYRSEGFEAYGLRKNYYTCPTEDAVLMKKELAV